MIPLRLLNAVNALLDRLGAFLFLPRDIRPAAADSAPLQGRLELPQFRTGAMAVPKARSQAVGHLVEAIQLRCKAEKEQDKESARMAIFQACANCYVENMARTEVKRIIEAVTAEFKVGSKP